MSAISATTSLGLSSVSPLATVNEPSIIRNGNQAAKNAYQTGLAFEQVLDNELSQAMTATISAGGSDSDGLGGTDDSSDSSGTDSSGGSSSPLGPYSSLMPQTMSQALTSGGSDGIAMQIARGIDPALNGAKS